MEMKNELFAIKLYELQKTYDTLLGCIETLAEKKPDELAKKIGFVKNELEDGRQSLKRYSVYSRLPLVSQIAEIQLDYYDKLDTIVKADSYRYEMDDSEKSALCAEYLMDCAMYSVRQAMAAALMAAYAQNENQ